MRIGIDAGGTFTDFIVHHDSGRLETFKLRSNPHSPASVILAGGAGALYLSQSSFWSVTADISGGSAGSVSGFMNMGGQIGGALTGSLTPWIAVRYSWTASFVVAAGLCLLGAFSWLFVDPVRVLVPPKKRLDLE